MSLSIIFSFVIFRVASNEIYTWLDRFQTSVYDDNDLTTAEITALSKQRSAEAAVTVARLSIELLYVNIAVLVLGGLGSYMLARKNLKPIEKAHEVQSRFTSDASHELRTPLAVMKTEIEVALQDKKTSVKELKSVLSSNLEEVDNLARLAEMLLTLSRFDHEKIKYSAVNLTKAARDVLKDFKLPSQRLTLLPSRQQVIRANDTAIHELIKILVDNALQYSPRDSQVTIAISQDGSFAKCDVTNTGPGISEAKLPHIFERFYRADSSRTSGEHKGYGLGLALAKQIVELHNGELSATSTPGHETTFSFSIILNRMANDKTTTKKSA
ncbi:MAG TPA: ATP-binding protein [Candidatus Saccharimonadales bacterium]|nr:ATP-binding protein [Candidatus Saccharimonadales bacterium]